MSQPKTLALNTKVGGSFTSDTLSVHREGSFAKFFTFEILGDSTIIDINLNASVGTVLFLLDGDSKNADVLTTSDSLSTQNNNAHVSQILDAGIYTLEVATAIPSTEDDFRIDTLLTIP